MTNQESTLWSVVFFKVRPPIGPRLSTGTIMNVDGQVEDTIFQVPQHRFTEHSEVFADMPQAGDANDIVFWRLSKRWTSEL
jgi:hypothetical protein